MTVKELKEKLEKLPDSAVVRLMEDSEYNPLQDCYDAYDAKCIYYLELVQKDGEQAVYITL